MKTSSVQQLLCFKALLLVSCIAVAQESPQRAPWLDRGDLNDFSAPIQTAPVRNLSDFDFQKKQDAPWMDSMKDAFKNNIESISEAEKDQIPKNLEMQIFISAGMPDGVLKSLFSQAAENPKGSVRFVVRGFTPQQIGKLLGHFRSLFPNPEADDFILDVDPNAFRAYSVDAVPVYLVKENDGKWFEVKGAQSLHAAKENVKKRSKDVQGELYAIAEPDILTVIEERAKSFDWEPVMKRAQARAAKNLKPGFDLPTAVDNATKFFIPTFTVPHDIEAPGKDGQGKVLLARAGQVVNLLDHTRLQVPVIVFDPGDRRQSRMVKEWLAKSEFKNADLFIVGTDLQAIDARTPVTEEIALSFKRPVYPMLSKLNERFGVEAVPSIVIQDGQRLRIQTYRPENF